MPIRSMTVRCYTPKRRPRVGDRKVTKDGTVLERRQCHLREGVAWFAQIQNGRPVCEWVPVATPHPWER